MTLPPRQTRQQVDEHIVDRAAALFAQRGFANTSVQAIADAVGFSKAGLLHHFPSKEALYAAAESLTQARLGTILERVSHLPVGPERDRLGLEELVDWALANPGQAALGLSFVVTDLTGGGPFNRPADGADGVPILLVFGVTPSSGQDDPDRVIRVVSALSAVLVVPLIAHSTGGPVAGWKKHVVAASFDALGHPRRDAGTPAAPDPEAS
ncbi:TetR/AcrR family transcriptional regulator [Modestobacter sp. SYSU DS0875]